MSNAEVRGPSIRLTAEAWALLIAARIGLRVLRFGRVRALARRLARRGSRTAGASRDEIAAAVAGASRAVPRATCLVRALAGAVLLARHGHAATLRIGVAGGGPDAIAHAWVESDGAIPVGENDERAYTPLPAIEIW